MTYPLAVSIAEQVKLVRVVEPVARALYGVMDPVVDVDATLARVDAVYRARAGGYGMRAEERDAARAVIAGRED